MKLTSSAAIKEGNHRTKVKATWERADGTPANVQISVRVGVFHDPDDELLIDAPDSDVDGIITALAELAWMFWRS